MPESAERWDYLDGFDEALETFRGIRGVTDEIADTVASWYDTREVEPHDGFPLPSDQVTDDDHTAWRADVRDRNENAVMVDGRQVVCYYEIHENDNKVVCSHFTLL